MESVIAPPFAKQGVECQQLPPIWLRPVVYCVLVSKIVRRGSDTYTSQQFLAAVDLEVAVICVGAHNPFGHPSAVVVERSIERLGEDNVYRTDPDGTMKFVTDEQTLWVKTDT